MPVEDEVAWVEVEHAFQADDWFGEKFRVSPVISAPFVEWAVGTVESGLNLVVLKGVFCDDYAARLPE